MSEPRPLALTTREDIGFYVASHGGGEDETRLLGQIVAALTRSPRYVEALAADLSPRVSILTGEAVDIVSEADRHSAALLIHAKALRSASRAGVQDVAPVKPKPPPPQPPKPPAPPPLAAQRPTATTLSPPSPFRNGAPLSATEIEKRKEALASLKTKSPA